MRFIYVIKNSVPSVHLFVRLSVHASVHQLINQSTGKGSKKGRKGQELTGKERKVVEREAINFLPIMYPKLIM